MKYNLLILGIVFTNREVNSSLIYGSVWYMYGKRENGMSLADRSFFLIPYI